MNAPDEAAALPAPPEAPTGAPLGATAEITRGAGRLLGDLGYDWLPEFRLATGRRVDLMGLDRRGAFVIIEVKSSLADFRADGKWRDYLDWCDTFYFAVAADFPAGVLPAAHGLIVADGFGAAIVREAAPAAREPPQGPDPALCPQGGAPAQLVSRRLSCGHAQALTQPRRPTWPTARNSCSTFST